MSCRNIKYFIYSLDSLDCALKLQMEREKMDARKKERTR